VQDKNWVPRKKVKNIHDPANNMKFKYNDTDEKIYLYLGNNTEKSTLEIENRPSDIPLNDIAYLKVSIIIYSIFYFL
jgi:hypothetical protein